MKRPTKGYTGVCTGGAESIKVVQYDCECPMFSLKAKPAKGTGPWVKTDRKADRAYW